MNCNTTPETAKKYLLHYLEVLINFNKLLDDSPIAEISDLEYVYGLVTSDITLLQQSITDEIKSDIDAELIKISELLEVIRKKLNGWHLTSSIQP